MKKAYTREEFLKSVRNFKTRVKITQIFTVVLILAFWELAGVTGLADAFIVSSPVRVVKTFISMAGKGLFVHVVYTVAETVIGFLIGVVLGFIISVGLWFSPFFNRVFAPFLVVLNSLPKIALGPVIIVWAGAGAGAIITMAVAISLIVTIIQLTEGFNYTDENLLLTVKSMGAGKWQSFCKIVLPYNVPVFFQSLKVNIGLSLVGVIAGEFLVSKAGLGYLIVYAGQVFRMDLVMMSVVLLGAIAFAMYAAVSRLEKWVTKQINHN